MVSYIPVLALTAASAILMHYLLKESGEIFKLGYILAQFATLSEMYLHDGIWDILPIVAEANEGRDDVAVVRSMSVMQWCSR